MKNISYRKQQETDVLEFYLIETNTLDPVIPLLEIEVSINTNEAEIEFNLEGDELDSLIDYLQDCRKYINKSFVEQKNNLPESKGLR